MAREIQLRSKGSTGKAQLDNCWMTGASERVDAEDLNEEERRGREQLLHYLEGLV